MDFKLVGPTDFALLSKILQKLQQKYKGHSNLTKNFYRSLPDNGQKPFAIAVQNGQIKIIYQLIHELKFTRGLQPVSHTEQLLNQASQQDLNKFQKWLINSLDGYKTLALNNTSKNVFKPHQFYMEAKNRPTL